VSFIRLFFEYEQQGIFNVTVFDGGAFGVVLTLAFGIQAKTSNMSFLGMSKASYLLSR
jgi:hypothetical protein